MPRGFPKSKFRDMYKKDTVNHGSDVRKKMAKINKKPVKKDIRQTSLFDENIKFQMPLESFYNSNNRNSYFQLFEESFGIKREQIDTSPLHNWHGQRGVHYVTVECSSKQFVYFQIRRDQMGLTNSFKELNVHYVNQPAPPKRDNKFVVAD